MYKKAGSSLNDTDLIFFTLSLSKNANGGKVEKASFIYSSITQIFCDPWSDHTMIKSFLAFGKFLRSSMIFPLISFRFKRNFKSLIFSDWIMTFGALLWWHLIHVFPGIMKRLRFYFFLTWWCWNQMMGCTVIFVDQFLGCW